ncbi:hypothetical protein L1887_47992 [Cichorium endivia]|nr:hypothetical protein L1887_47992 [Cichorium endivia]
MGIATPCESTTDGMCHCSTWRIAGDRANQTVCRSRTSKSDRRKRQSTCQSSRLSGGSRRVEATGARIVAPVNPTAASTEKQPDRWQLSILPDIAATPKRSGAQNRSCITARPRSSHHRQADNDGEDHDGNEPCRQHTSTTARTRQTVRRSPETRQRTVEQRWRPAPRAP